MSLIVKLASALGTGSSLSHGHGCDVDAAGWQLWLVDGGCLWGRRRKQAGRWLLCRFCSVMPQELDAPQRGLGRGAVLQPGHISPDSNSHPFEFRAGGRWGGRALEPPPAVIRDVLSPWWARECGTSGCIRSDQAPEGCGTPVPQASFPSSCYLAQWTDVSRGDRGSTGMPREQPGLGGLRSALLPLAVSELSGQKLFAPCPVPLPGCGDWFRQPDTWQPVGGASPTPFSHAGHWTWCDHALAPRWADTGFPGDQLLGD